MPVLPHIKNLGESYIRNILAVVNQPGVISLAGGLPAPELFPLKHIAELAPEIILDSRHWQYGLTQGYEPLLEWIAEQHHCDKQQVLMTNGAQQSLDLIARTLLAPGEQVIIEAPAYVGTMQTLALTQASPVWIQQLDANLDLAQLEQAMACEQAKYFYCVPDFHNPTGACWSLELRQAVLKLAQQHQVLIVEDAPYRGLHFTSKQLPSLFDLAHELAPDLVIHIGSFSKCVAPGLRLGYNIAPTSLSPALHKVKQTMDLHTSSVNQALLWAFINSGRFQPHVDHIRRVYQERMHALTKALHKVPNTSFHPVTGGMFVWLRLHNHQANVVAQHAIKHQQLAVVPSQAFMPQDKNEHGEYLRLNFTNNSCSELALGVDRLQQALQCSVTMAAPSMT